MSLGHAIMRLIESETDTDIRDVKIGRKGSWEGIWGKVKQRIFQRVHLDS